MEVDDSVGRILDALANAGVENNTMVILSSDNGAATYSFDISGPTGGNNGALLCGKETTFEGGMREPTVVYWPSNTPAGGSVSHEIVTLMDVFTTALNLAGVALPSDRIIDGQDITHVLRGGKSSTENVFFYRGNGLFAVRSGRYKAHFWTWDNTPNPTGPDNHPGDDAEFCPGQISPNVTTSDMRDRSSSPLLFDLWTDPGERYPIAPSVPLYTTAIASIMAAVAQHQSGLVKGAPILNLCDVSTGNWAPPGCEVIGMCLPIPTSNVSLCPWRH